MYRIKDIQNSSTLILLRSNTGRSSWNISKYEHAILESTDIRILRRLPMIPRLLQDSLLLLYNLLPLTELCPHISYLLRVIRTSNVNTAEFILLCHKQFQLSSRITEYYRITVKRLDILNRGLLYMLDQISDHRMNTRGSSGIKFNVFLFSIYAEDTNLYSYILEGKVTPTLDVLLNLPVDRVLSLLYSEYLPDYLYDIAIEYVYNKLIPIDCRLLKIELLDHWERGYDDPIIMLLLYAVNKPSNKKIYNRWCKNLRHNNDLCSKLCVKLLRLFHKYNSKSSHKLLNSLSRYRLETFDPQTEKTIGDYWEICRQLINSNK